MASRRSHSPGCSANAVAEARLTQNVLAEFCSANGQFYASVSACVQTKQGQFALDVLGFLPQLPARQVFGLVHSADVEHVVRQAPPAPHW